MSTAHGQHDNHHRQSWFQNQFTIILDVLKRTWFLGFTSFGGPVVHFQIFRKLFVEGKDPWLDEQTYMELFAITQSLPGPASTKFGFCMTMMRAGIVGAIIEFLLWSLPGAISIFLLSIGISHVPSTLPRPVYALLSGLNAAAVGLIILAGFQLARRAITDKLTLILVVFTGCAGICYNALWYFPVLMVTCGIVCWAWEIWVKEWVAVAKKWVRRKWVRRKKTGTPDLSGEEGGGDIEMDISHIGAAPPISKDNESVASRRTVKPEGSGTSGVHLVPGPSTVNEANLSDKSHLASSVDAEENFKPKAKAMSPRTGILLIGIFLISFIIIMVLNATLKNPSLELQLFRNMYLAGTIIFGGGPVVIPLLRAYVVDPGWVTPRDFLIGLAITQAFPGPNFNFAVYLGALAIRAEVSSPSTHSPILGAFLGFIGIFTPGLILATGFQSLWHLLRTKRSVIQILRGVNAGAVGLVFSAVYRIWEAGYLQSDTEIAGGNVNVKGRGVGTSLGKEPWWVVVATVAYSLSEWFDVETWVAIPHWCGYGAWVVGSYAAVILSPNGDMSFTSHENWGGIPFGAASTF